MSGSDQRWIEAESMKNKDDDDDEGFDSLFADPDPFDTFAFEWKYGTRDIQIRLHGHKQELGQTLNSTGLTLWRASNILCDFLVQHAAELVANKKILEVSSDLLTVVDSFAFINTTRLYNSLRTMSHRMQLGAGLGLCGILASRLDAASVTLTDGDTDTLENMRSNVASNADADKVSCRQLVWGQRVQEFVGQHGEFDVIMGADIIYIEEVLSPLFMDTIPKLLTENGRFLLAYARRNVSIDKVLAMATRAGLSYSQLDGPEGVYVFRKARSP
jgi:hypothetical protein